MSGIYFFDFVWETKYGLLVIAIFSPLAIIVVFVLLFVDATQDKPFVGFIFLCFYAIFLAVILYVLATHEVRIVSVIVWCVVLLVCALGLFLGYKVKTDLTKTAEGYIGYFLPVFLSGII
ncbi:unnamed protein product, partial [Trichobilharzia szidati]